MYIMLHFRYLYLNIMLYYFFQVNACVHHVGITNRTAAGGAAAGGDGALIEKIRRERAAALSAIATPKHAFEQLVDGDVARLMPGRSLHALDTICRSFHWEGGTKFVADALLLHLATHHPVPSIDQYKELLPKRSNYEYDVCIYARFAEAPSLLCVLDIVSRDPAEFRRCWQVVRSLLASSLGYWHSIKDNRVDRSKHHGQMVISCQLLESMGEP